MTVQAPRRIPRGGVYTVDRFVQVVPSRHRLDLAEILRTPATLEELGFITPRVSVEGVVHVLSNATSLRSLSLGESWLSPQLLDVVIDSRAPLETLRLNCRQATRAQAAAFVSKVPSSSGRLILIEPTAEALRGVVDGIARSSPANLILVRPLDSEALAIARDLARARPGIRLLGAYANSLLARGAFATGFVGHELIWPPRWRSVTRVDVDSCVDTLPELAEDKLSRVEDVQIHSTLLRRRALSSWLRRIKSLSVVTLPAELVGEGLRLPPLRRLRLCHLRRERMPSQPDLLEFLRTVQAEDLELISVPLSLERAQAIAANTSVRSVRVLLGAVSARARTVLGSRHRNAPPGSR